MMELVFNELSAQPYAVDFSDCYSRIEQFFKTYKAAILQGFKGVRFQQVLDQIMLQNNYSIAQFISDARAKTFADILFAIYRHPLIDDDSEEEDRYIQNNFFILKDGQKVSVHGLAAAYLYNTAGIGFCSEPFWNNILFPLQIEGEEKRIENVLSVSCPEHLTERLFLEWKSQNEKVHLIESDTKFSDKNISLRDDHGKDVLMQFAKRLVKSPYVIEVVNSLPYNSNSNHFIRKAKHDGLIEIVLTKSDKGLGLVVKTTGRNYKETAEIAKILKHEFE